MRKTGKLISIMLSICLFLSLTAIFANAEDNAASYLQFNSGKFKVLVYSDLHYSGNDAEEWEDQINFFNASLDTVEPDLVVFLGDNITAGGVETQAACIRKIMQPVIERDLYFAVIFGNHDAEQNPGMTRAEQLAVYQEYDKCLAVAGPDDIYGVGNYNIVLKDSNGENDKFNLWFMDSNSYPESAEEKAESKYDYVHTDQIEWYEETCQALADANGGNVLPAVMFQHICVPEMYNLLVKTYPWAYTVLGHGSYSNSFWKLDPDNDTIEGNLWEPPCPPDINNGQFDSWLKMGDIQLAISGHDHSNNFSGEVEGIRLMFAGVAGMSAYGNGANYQASLLVIDEETLTVERENIKYTDVVGKYLAHFSFFDYFEYDCWFSILKLDFKPLMRCFITALKATFAGMFS